MPKSPYRTKRPTEAQARKLAFTWGTLGNSIACPVEGYTDPTIAVLKKNGWIAPNGKGGIFPNGYQFERYEVTPAGLAALEVYFADLRYKAAG